MRAQGFHVTTDIGSLPAAPDVIQANQTYPLLEAVGRFPQVPAVSICHDAKVWFSEPVDLPVIRRHIAVDLACRDRIAERLSLASEQIEILHNAVDLDRFARGGPPPRAPKRALVITKNAVDLNVLRAACDLRGIALDVLGPAIDREVDDLAARLHDYDLVF